MNLSNYRLPILLLPCLLYCACIVEDRSEVPDVGHLLEDIDIVHFGEQLLSTRDTSNLRLLIAEYPTFSEVFAGQVLTPQHGNNLLSRLNHFATDTATIQLYEYVVEAKAWNESTKAQLADAFARGRYYLNDFKIPQVYTCISQFEVGSFTIGADILGIGLDFYLGESFPYNPSVFPDYIARTMTPEYLVPKSVHVLLDQLVGPTSGSMALDHMIRNGIVLYLKEKLLPHFDETIIHEFTEEQMAWIEENEGEIWAYLVGEDLLHETSERKYRKLVFPSPTVPGMPDEAPGRVGNWIGYQIVLAYVKRTGATAEDLLHIKDSQKVLTLAKYRPQRVAG